MAQRKQGQDSTLLTVARVRISTTDAVWIAVVKLQRNGNRGRIAATNAKQGSYVSTHIAVGPSVAPTRRTGKARHAIRTLGRSVLSKR